MLLQIIFLTMSQMKSKQRVADHGEVFTPAWTVDAMLDLVKAETQRYRLRFLGARVREWGSGADPAAGTPRCRS